MKTVVVSVVVWCVAVVTVRSVPWHQQDARCSKLAWCGECIREAGCVWCAAPEMTPASTPRCRASESAQDSWCPALHRLDGSGQLVQPDAEPELGLQHLTQDEERGARLSPESALVVTSNNRVQFTFLVDGVQTPNDEVYIWYEGSLGEQKELLRPDWAPVQEGDRRLSNVTVNIDVNEHVEDCSEGVLHVGFAERARVKVRLRRDCRECGCPDSEAQSKKCNGRGRLECGVCQCREGWKGTNCEKEQCGNRGDITANTCLEIGADRNCSGVGVCRCGRCECGPGDFVGDFCRDLCSGTADCALCLYHNRVKINQVAHDGDYHALCADKCPSEMRSRTSGVSCVATADDGCALSYRVLAPWPYVHALDSNCSLLAGAVAGDGGSMVGAVVAGVMGLAVAAAAAVALLWYARSGSVDPLAGTQYDQMPVTPNQGENPLYKPPVTSYNNPLYRKT